MTGAWRYSTGADCVRHWRWFPNVGRPEIARVALACTRAAVLAIPLALPGAAFVPAVGSVPVAYPPAVLTGPAYETGALFVPGVYGMPRGTGLTSRPVGPVGGMPAEVGSWTLPTATGGYPVTTYGAPHDVPVWVPGQGAPIDVPEPSTWLLMLGAFGMLVCWLVVKADE